MRRGSAGVPPDESNLHEAALAHLARYATTQAGLCRVLERRIDRWARAQSQAVEAEDVARAKAAARAIVARLAAAGAVDDAAFAAARAARLARTGRSRRAIAAHLAARGVDGKTIADASPHDPEAEFAAAIKLASRRRIGPFRTAPADEYARRREQAMMARAGFSRDVALRALGMDAAAAGEILRRRKDR